MRLRYLQEIEIEVLNLLFGNMSLLFQKELLDGDKSVDIDEHINDILIHRYDWNQQIQEEDNQE